jgi:hypothetical protein
MDWRCNPSPTEKRKKGRKKEREREKKEKERKKGRKEGRCRTINTRNRFESPSVEVGRGTART